VSKKLKEKIEELEVKHRVVADNLLDAIWVIDVATLKFEYITPSIKKISGYAADEFKNFTIMDRLTPESYRKVEATLTEEIPRFEQGVKAIRKMEVELIHKDGSIYWAEIRTKFVKEFDKPLKIIGVTREITERKKTEQHQNELIQKLGEALAEKERLLKENKVLHGLLPICSGCKRIRDEHDRWWPLDAYVKSRTDTEITHTICPDCTKVFYDDL
jgi:PAS domain S-box-containing protein